MDKHRGIAAAIIALAAGGLALAAGLETVNNAGLHSSQLWALSATLWMVAYFVKK